jgi:chemotaxis protein CheD
MHDARAGVGGMLHYQLPSSLADPQRASEKPLMYADTGTQWLLERMLEMGADRKRMRVRVAGGAALFNDRGLFDIGRRNYVAIRKVLWRHGLFLDVEHIGGNLPRTLKLNVGDGSLLISCGNEDLKF